MPTGGTTVPLSVIVISLVIASLVVALTWLFLPKQASAPRGPAAAAAADTVAAPDTGLDVRWRGNRQDKTDCVGTFEVTRGGGTPAQFTAFMLDSAGGVIARDSARVGSAVRGLLVEFRFRRLSCKAIADWQLQVATPKAAPAQARD